MKTSLSHALHAALRVGGGGTILRSRLASPNLLQGLDGLDCREVPAVRGRAAWPRAGSGTAVFEWPGWLGQAERKPARPRVCISAVGTRPDWTCDALIVDRVGRYELVDPNWGPEPTDVEDFRLRTALARRLVAHVTQARGVATGWPAHSPRALILVPVDPGLLQTACPPPDGLSLFPLTGFAEFPGGLRLEVQSNVDETDLRSWSAGFTAAVTSGERRT